MFRCVGTCLVYVWCIDTINAMRWYIFGIFERDARDTLMYKKQKRQNNKKQTHKCNNNKKQKTQFAKQSKTKQAQKKTH